MRSGQRHLAGQRFSRSSRLVPRCTNTLKIFVVVRGLGTWHCLPPGNRGRNGVPTQLSSGVGVVPVRGGTGDQKNRLNLRVAGKGPAKVPQCFCKPPVCPKQSRKRCGLVRPMLKRAPNLIALSRRRRLRAIRRSVDMKLLAKCDGATRLYGGPPGFPIEMSCDPSCPWGRKKKTARGEFEISEIFLADKRRGPCKNPATLKGSPSMKTVPGGLGGPSFPSGQASPARAAWTKLNLFSRKEKRQEYCAHGEVF